ncbi:ABC transporter ATP-binding protein [Clostridium sp. Cult2]|uniref:ABC transporter ATP-binding protein n=1 Tax=Clostridium sp. Cult2 TaxID=2079003 RepID=UPI001F3815D1|nr:ABC transporter ATP-binding protein [Clostridium sp. Cult2]MCF6464383.1 dipeptide/oligopeptide/nickel ABC transporter ATP-binding protein [Clostridium sp. Cult2]
MLNVLDIKNLAVTFKTKGRMVKAVDDVSLSVKKGEKIGLVGESGAGKSVMAKTVLGLLKNSKNIAIEGEIYLNGENLLVKNKKELEKLRGSKISMIFQDPINSLNPVFTVGYQIAEVFMIHKKMNKKDAWLRAIDMLGKVGIESPSLAAKQYPHQFSGGMCQRVMIAMALSANPQLLIADEPTTALDVTIQAQILELLNELYENTDTSIMLITHDLGVVSEFCQSVAVMLNGVIVEKADVKSIFKNPLHPYTQGLLSSIPVIGSKERLKPLPNEYLDDNAIIEGCPFYNRCLMKIDRCKYEKPKLYEIKPDHFVRCFKNEVLIKNE